MIHKDLSTGRGKCLPMLLKARQHSKIALIEHRTAVPMNIVSASLSLLFGSTVLRDRCTGQEKRQGADEKDIRVHGNLFLAVKGAVVGGTDVTQGRTSATKPYPCQWFLQTPRMVQF
jgi:hypothetical protein